MLCWVRPIFLRSLLRHSHSNQVPDAPLASDALCVCVSLWGTDCRWLEHSTIRRVDGLLIISSVSCMKPLQSQTSGGDRWLASQNGIDPNLAHAVSLGPCIYYHQWNVFLHKYYFYLKLFSLKFPVFIHNCMSCIINTSIKNRFNISNLP